MSLFLACYRVLFVPHSFLSNNEYGSCLPNVDMHAARMYNIARLCPGRLPGRPFVCIPASPYLSVGADPEGSNRP